MLMYYSPSPIYFDRISYFTYPKKFVTFNNYGQLSFKYVKILQK